MDEEPTTLISLVKKGPRCDISALISELTSMSPSATTRAARWRDRQHVTVWHRVAIAQCPGTVVQELLRVPAFADNSSLNARNVRGATLLHWVANNGDAFVVELLCAARADPNLAHAGGDTPLHSSVLGNHITVVAQLLQCGVDANWRNNFGKTALDVAQELGHDPCVTLLTAHSKILAALSTDHMQGTHALFSNRSLLLLIAAYSVLYLPTAPSEDKESRPS